MKMQKIQITVTQLENGDILLGSNFDSFFVKTSDGIHEYTYSEMEEIYGLEPADFDLLKSKPTQFLVRHGLVTDPHHVYCIILSKEREFNIICSHDDPKMDKKVTACIQEMQGRGFEYIES